MLKSFTGWECTGHMLCIVDKSLSVLMIFRMCLREFVLSVNLSELLSHWRRHWHGRQTVKIHIKVFYVIVKALSGELFCRSTGLVIFVSCRCLVRGSVAHQQQKVKLMSVTDHPHQQLLLRNDGNSQYNMIQ